MNPRYHGRKTINRCESTVRGLFFVFVLWVFLSFPGLGYSEAAPGDYQFTISYDGLLRSYEVHVPTSYDGNPTPLVVDFHGMGSDINQQKSWSGFLEKSEEAGFIVSWPQGWGEIPSWNAGTCCGEALRLGLDDVGLSAAIVEEIGERIAIDPSRIYATGLSNGGAFTHYLACEASHVFAAFAPVSFPLPVPSTSDCQPDRGVPLKHFHGFDDFFVPYWQLHRSYVPRSAPESFHDWAEIDECSDNPTTTYRKEGSFCRTYDACLGNVEVTLCSIQGGHILYENLSSVDLADLAWEFFSKYALND